MKQLTWYVVTLFLVISAYLLGEYRERQWAAGYIEHGPLLMSPLVLKQTGYAIRHHR